MLTGYSVGTVSRVLNDQPNVSPKARERILAAAKKHGFTLNENAKNLKQHQSNSILAVVRGSMNILFERLVEQLQDLTVSGPYQLVVDHIDEMEDEVSEAIRQIRVVKPRGLLFLGTSQENFVESFGRISIPAVLVTNTAAGLGFDNLSSVATDDEAAAREVVSLLLDKGHRKIGIIGGDLAHSDPSRLRYAGCLAAFAEHGAAFAPNVLYRTARFDYAGGYSAMSDLLMSHPEITAVFAMSDAMAIGAARAIRDAGKTIPEDISIVGFDGLPICRYYQPRLATVVQRTEEMARESYSLLLSAIQGNSVPRHLRLSYELEINESIRDIR